VLEEPSLRLKDGQAPGAFSSAGAYPHGDPVSVPLALAKFCQLMHMLSLLVATDMSGGLAATGPSPLESATRV
jgi:hypothetical protein